MKFNHKPDCIFNDFYKSLMSRDPNGPDSRLTIDENGVDFDYNEWTTDNEDYTIAFHFCPCCGVPEITEKYS